MFSKKFFIATVLTALTASSSVFAQGTSLQDLQDLPSSKLQVVDSSKAFQKSHWAYKTLENITKKYGLLVGSPNEKFDVSKPLTRKEATVLLVSLVGKIEQDNLTFSDGEKAQIEILRQELSEETKQLAGRVAKIETSVDELKGNVSKVQSSDAKSWKYDFGEKLKINGGLHARYTGTIQRGADFSSNPSNFSIPVADITLSGKLHKNIRYVLNTYPSRNFSDTTVNNGILGDIYVATEMIPHHSILFGQARTPIGQEGAQSPYTIETVNKSQISRLLADKRDIGVKVSGTWPVIDYFLGAYNGTSLNAKDNNGDMDLAFWSVVKPLYKYPKLGSLELGGGYYAGKNTYSYNTTGFYGAYKYKKYAIQAEYAYKDGYNAINREADGWYVHNSYYLTPKLQLVARFDTFDPNNGLGKNEIEEYTFGSNYYLSNQNLKLMFNLVHVDNKAAKDSQRVVVQTQYKF